jgi:hypothetical protein
MVWCLIVCLLANGWSASKVTIGRRKIAQALMVAPVVVEADKLYEPRFQLPGQIVMLSRMRLFNERW